MKKFLANLPNILKLTYEGWKEDHASRLSAALAYYTIFSLAPLLVIVIAITGLLGQADIVRIQLIDQIQGLVGAEGSRFANDLITSASNPAQGIAATIIGLVTLLFGALGVFNELHNSLNIIWDIKEEKSKGFLQTIKKVVIDRLLSFTMILGIGFMLLVSLVISAGLSVSEETIGNIIPIPEFLLQILNLIISIGVITILFTLMFKFLPDAEIAWRDVVVGAFMTSVFFSLGKMVIGIYLGNSAVASTFGAAGSLAVILVWIYYSAQILFFGAEFTQVYANNYGSKIVPEAGKQTEKTSFAQSQGTTPLILTFKPERDEKLEMENQQTARVVFGMMTLSFLTGALMVIFGFKKK